MNHSQTLLTDLKAAHGDISDYRVAQILGLRPQAISKVKCNRNHFSDVTVVKIANELGVNPVEAVAKVHLDDETCPIKRQLWEQILGETKVAESLGISGFQHAVVA